MSTDRGVSPVIGTVLLVAITVILASMTSVFILGFMETISQDTPLTTFGTDQDGQNYTLTHMGGDTLDSENVYVIVGGSRTKWSNYSGTDQKVNPGDSITITEDISGDQEEIMVVYVDNSYSSTLHQSTLYDRGNDGDSGSNGGEVDISSYSASNPSGQNIAVSFDADKSLDSIRVDISGAESATLTESDFSNSDGAYSATYSGSSDGDYTVTLKEAVDNNGNDGSEDQSDIVSVRTSVLNYERTITYSGLTALSSDGGDTESIGVSGIDALGSGRTDIDGDGYQETAYVNNGNLNIIDSTDSTETLVSDSDSSNPDTDKTLMTVGSWQGSGTSVFYVNKNHNTIYQVDSSGSTSVVATPGNGANAVLGFGDVDDDGSEELIFADGSQQTRYINSDGSIEKIENGGVGSNNGIGVGQVADLDGDGTPRIATIDGSNNVRLVGVSESDITFSSTSAAKSPVTVSDIDNDSQSEIVYVSSSGNIRYIDDPLGTSQLEDVTDADGNVVTGDESIGVTSG